MIQFCDNTVAMCGIIGAFNGLTPQGRVVFAAQIVTFTYTYRSSDGVRHTDTIDAESRDVVFSTLRERGIKPIKVVATDGSKANGEVRVKVGVPKRVVAGICATLLVAVGFAYWMGSQNGETERATVVTPQGTVTFTVASPLPRQAIAGDRRRIEKSIAEIFRFQAEAMLARFAEPGRSFDAIGSASISCDAWKGCLDTPIRIASTDFTEIVDLKRIVTGMKREMRGYLLAGGTVEDYFTELIKRQRLEISYRERAESKLKEMLLNPESGKESSEKRLAAAYSYWMKSNASLKSMGIYELALPDALREYQANIDF